jgi:uncharacterized protein (UPF0332 family)
MTRVQQALAIETEVNRGRESFKSSEILLQSGLYADAVSRAYYGALHFARALLLTTSEEPKTHSGVLRLISRDFVRSGKLQPEIAQLLSALEKQRSDADYTAEIVFTATAAAEDVARARSFMEAVSSLLMSEGWLKP